ncbi:MAG: hypothetical protein DRH17_08240 [Deltaproteobacteria bacterium]|nr:MAG: hypothetical protein DRH17_08240 [Deltaproteobacteria bacterium]
MKFEHFLTGLLPATRSATVRQNPPFRRGQGKRSNMIFFFFKPDGMHVSTLDCTYKVNLKIRYGCSENTGFTLFTFQPTLLNGEVTLPILTCDGSLQDVVMSGLRSQLVSLTISLNVLN